MFSRPVPPRSCHSALTGSRNSGANGSRDPRQCAAYSELPALSSFSLSVLSLPRPSPHLSKRTPLILLARSSMLAAAFLVEYQAGSPTRRTRGEPVGTAQRLHPWAGSDRSLRRGLRYGKGTLFTKNAGDLAVYWQGPSLGWDFGGDGARTMMLVYNLPATGAVYQRFGGVAGSAYFVGGAWHDRSFRQWHGSSSDPFRNGTAARGQYR